jgi:survival-of-motor-neuron-related-splicing factor 30
MASQLEEERKAYEEQVRKQSRKCDDISTNQHQLEIVAASLKDEPGNAELQALKDELDQMIQMIDESLAELKPKQQQQQQQQQAAKPAAPKPVTTSQTAAPPPQEKWSRENHPAFKKPTPTPAAPQEEEKEQLITYQVNDTVMAKWVSGDKGFYPARITAVTGSSAKPIYTVKFKSYDTIETLGVRDIRPVGGAAAAGQKRKADDTAAAAAAAAVAATPGTSSNGVVLAAPATVYPTAKDEGEEKPVKKFKKIKATKELEKGKSKWQEFNAKTAGKLKHKKDSMFRTPEGVGGRGMFLSSSFRSCW